LQAAAVAAQAALPEAELKRARRIKAVVQVILFIALFACAQALVSSSTTCQCTIGGKVLTRTTSMLRPNVMLRTSARFWFGVIHDPPVVSVHAMVTSVQVQIILSIKMPNLSNFFLGIM
jgi:hypothetical protein